MTNEVCGSARTVGEFRYVCDKRRGHGGPHMTDGGTPSTYAWTGELRWFAVRLEYEPCGGYGCHSRTVTEIVAADGERAALALADDDEAVRAYVSPLELPDLSRKRTPFTYKFRRGGPDSLYRPASWEELALTGDT